MPQLITVIVCLLSSWPALWIVSIVSRKFKLTATGVRRLGEYMGREPRLGPRVVHLL
jgi:hypothetical protein